MAPQITPEMWGYMAGTAALEKSARPTSKKNKGGGDAPRSMGAPKGRGGKRKFGSPKVKPKVKPPKGGSVGGMLRSKGRAAMKFGKKHWKPLAAGAGVAGAGLAAYNAMRSRGKKDDEE